IPRRVVQNVARGTTSASAFDHVPPSADPREAPAWSAFSGRARGIRHVSGNRNPHADLQSLLALDLEHALQLLDQQVNDPESQPRGALDVDAGSETHPVVGDHDARRSRTLHAHLNPYASTDVFGKCVLERV